MKPLWILLLCTLCACSPGDREVESEDTFKLRVLSMTPMIDDLVGKIGGDDIVHDSLIHGDIDPHNYELVKDDGDRIMQADIVFYNGLGLEHGASLKNQLNRHACALPLGDYVYQRDPSKFLEVNGQIDPHIWMDIELFSHLIEPIVATLSNQLPHLAEIFFDRGQQLKSEMQLKDRQLCHIMQQVPSHKRFLVTSHDAFHYFVRKYLADPDEEERHWKERLIAPEGLAPDGQMSVLDIQRVAQFLCRHQITVVFPESNINRDALKKIAAMCAKKNLCVKIANTPIYGDTMGDKRRGVHSYIAMIEHNIFTISENLTQD